MAEEQRQTYAEEVLNSLTHGFGLVLSAAGLAVLVVLATLFGDIWHIVSSTIFGSTLVFLYGASTLYHSARTRRMKRILRIVDHIAIFLLIAGTAGVIFYGWHSLPYSHAIWHVFVLAGSVFHYLAVAFYVLPW
ncbi:MAG: hypothetical protein GVY25_00990 [Bacteroidetes bacterium]|jgi:predicted membrane channel-forming protein YqfA (hemolysin III family)|nr:hypothetical protein [Bacteroidota bacterium]